MYDTKELDEALYALAKLMNSGKASFDDDGQLTFSDAFNFVDDVVPVWNGISGAQLILVNLGDLTTEQREASKAAFFEELEFPPEDEAAFEHVLNLLFSLIQVLVSFKVIPPAPEVVVEEPVIETPTEEEPVIETAEELPSEDAVEPETTTEPEA